MGVLNQQFNPPSQGTSEIKNMEKAKVFTIDYSKVKTVEDVVLVLKAVGLTIHWFTDPPRPEFKELLDKGFLIEQN